MSLNLSRRTKMFVSTAVPGTDTPTASNTWEVPILNGYSFSQDTASQTITLNEAGNAPVRGQSIFNTAINPADISFPTYVRPFYNTTHKAVEQILWEALVGPGGGTSASPAFKYALDKANYMEVNFKGSNQHELMKLYLYFQLDNTTYRIDDVAINSVEVDFSIDTLAKLTWSAQGKSITEVDTSSWTAGVDYLAANANAKFIKNKLSSLSVKKTTGTTSAYQVVNYGGALDPTVAHGLGTSGTYTVDVNVNGAGVQTISVNAANIGSTVQDVIDEINYFLNDAIVLLENGNLKFITSTSGSTTTISVTDGSVNGVLSNMSTSYVSDGSPVAGTGTIKIYNVPITGGKLTIENNITYLTPEELGKVNAPVGSFTGTRAVSGSISAYLNTGANNTGGLLSDLASDLNTVTQEFELNMQMGGGSNVPRVDFIMNHAHLTIPTINTEDVLTTEVQFTGLGENINASDELLVRYYAQ